MPKPRTTRNLPKHIQPDREKLPRGVQYNVSGTLGHWRIGIGNGKTKYLCNGAATLSQIHQAAEANRPINVKQRVNKTTFRGLFTAWQDTRYFKELKPDTKKSYLTAFNHICKTKTKNGNLADESIAAWTVGTVRNYRDLRGEKHPGSANIELALMKSVLQWAYEHEHITANPAAGMRALKRIKRSHYVTDRDFEFFIASARKTAPWYIPVVAEISLACRGRLNEVLNLTAANETPEGIRINRLKGSRDGIIRWSPRLRKAWDLAIKNSSEYSPVQQFKKEHRYLFISKRTKDKVTDDAFSRSWKLAMDKAAQEAMAAGIDFAPFQHRDMRKKAVTDDPSHNKMAGSGHRTASVAADYDLSIPKVDSII